MNYKKYIIKRLDQVLTILKDPVSLKARIAGCYFEIFKTINYLKQNEIYPQTIIDVGANRGMFSFTANYIYPNITIYAFEPLKSCFVELKSLENKIKNFKCYNLALGNKKEELNIYHNDYDYSSSILEIEQLHKEAFPYTANVLIEKINVDRLDTVLENKIVKPCLLKIDVQGYEKFVLEGAKKILPEIDYIICELSFYNLYKGQPLFHEVYSILVDIGFEFLGPINENRHPQSNVILQIDAFFKRKKI